MRKGDEVIWTRGAKGLTGTVTDHEAFPGLVMISTKHGVFAESPLNLICVQEADPKLVMKLKEWQEVNA